MPRWLDLLVAMLLFVILSPLILLLAIWARLTFGSAFYRQARCGFGGRPFVIHKVTTMHPDRRKGFQVYDGPERRFTHKSATDPRMTRVSSVVRRLGLDELPQLYNVIIGEMSLVGPRPELMTIATKRRILHHVRHSVKPGITGLWQVKIHSQNGDMLDYLHLDQQYIEEKNTWTDLKLLAVTPLAVLKRILR